MANASPRVLRAEWFAAAAGPDQFPAPDLPEFAFIGRSNVGKSSLLNRLVSRKNLARTSSTPGKTRLVHWYRVERTRGEVWLVDLPGYGYAKVSKSEREKWQPLIESYLEARPTLRGAVLLQDLRRDWSDDEALLAEWLKERDVPVLVAVTKTDKLKPMRRAHAVKKLKESIGLPKANVLPTSASSGDGIPELWTALDRLVNPNRG